MCGEIYMALPGRLERPHRARGADADAAMTAGAIATENEALSFRLRNEICKSTLSKLAGAWGCLRTWRGCPTRRVNHEFGGR